MAKPIFIIKFSNKVMKDQDLIKSIRERTSKQLYDYHVLIGSSSSLEYGEMEFECFNSPKANKHIKNKKYKIK